MLTSLASSSLSMTGRGKKICRHDSGCGSSRLRSGPKAGAERRDQFLADRIERWIGDLREELLEVVVQEAGPVREHRDRRVGAHRPDRLGRGAGHRLEHELQLFGGVPEGQLAFDDRPVRRQLVGGLGQQVELDQVVVEPALEGPARSQSALDLVVTDDAALGRVDEEHAARLQATLLHDAARARRRARRPPTP